MISSSVVQGILPKYRPRVRCRWRIYLDRRFPIDPFLGCDFVSSHCGLSHPRSIFPQQSRKRANYSLSALPEKACLYLVYSLFRREADDIPFCMCLGRVAFIMPGRQAAQAFLKWEVKEHDYGCRDILLIYLSFPLWLWSCFWLLGFVIAQTTCQVIIMGAFSSQGKRSYRRKVGLSLLSPVPFLARKE